MACFNSCSETVSQSLHHWTRRTIFHLPFKPEPPNLDSRCKPAWLWSPLFRTMIKLDLQSQILLVIPKPTVVTYRAGGTLAITLGQSPSLQPESDHRCLMLFESSIFYLNRSAVVFTRFTSGMRASGHACVIPISKPRGLQHPGSCACAPRYLVCSCHGISKHLSSDETAGQNMGLQSIRRAHWNYVNSNPV